jgi:hypothetical protein
VTDVPIADVAKKKPLERINDVLIVVNNNLIPVDFLVIGRINRPIGL